MIRSRPIVFSALLVSALALGFFAARLTEGDAPATATGEGGTKDRKIAYWVGPMDPSYRRDEPGKSPMGMDLIPVYEGEESGSSDGQPALRINPAVVNNIGVRTELVRRTDLARRKPSAISRSIRKSVPTSMCVAKAGSKSSRWKRRASLSSKANFCFKSTRRSLLPRSPNICKWCGSAALRSRRPPRNACPLWV